MPKASDSQYQDQSSPARTQKGAGSPTKRKTGVLGATAASPTIRKGASLKSPTKKERGDVTVDGKQDGLSSPTSISMQNTFLIKNAD